MEDQPLSPRISALIVTHQAVAPTRRLLESLEASQGREAWEFVVVDNGSTDGTGQLESEFPHATFLRLPRHFGRTKALNIGTRTAKGDYLLLLQPSMSVAPETLGELLAATETLPDAGAVCPLTVDPQGHPMLFAAALPTPSDWQRFQQSGAFPASPLQPAEEPIPVGFPQNAAFLVKRDFVKGMNYFDERYGEFGPEAELCFQVRQFGKKVYVLPKTQITADAISTPDLPTYAADRVNAAAAYIGKRNGFTTGLSVRLTGALKALGRGQLRQAGYVAVGQKIDGTQKEP